MQSDPNSFLKKLNEIKSAPSFTAYNNLWKSLDHKNHALSNTFDIKSEKLTDLIVFKTILEKIPTCILHMSNSSVVRYCQLFNPKKEIEYRANRGTSGIDGSTSTAMGAAYSDPEQLHVLISGDVSFLYDSNALWNSYQAKNLKIIIVNNQGGGIFRIIPGASESKQLDVYFEAKHKQISEDEETRKNEITNNFEEHLKSIKQQMKDESDKQSKEDNSVVAETKRLTETYNSLV